MTTNPGDRESTAGQAGGDSGAAGRQGGQHFQLQTLRVDLSGSDLAEIHPHESVEAGVVQRQVSIGQLGFVASPISLLSAPLHLEVSAAEVVFTHQPGHPERSFAVELKQATATIEIDYAALDQLVLMLLNRSLRPQNVSITSVKLTLESSGPKRLSFSGRAAGRKGILSSTLDIRGGLEIDERLEARLTEVKLSGPGILGQILAGFLQHHVNKLDNRPIPLGTSLPGALRFTDIELHTAQRLRIVGRIGGPST